MVNYNHLQEQLPVEALPEATHDTGRDPGLDPTLHFSAETLELLDEAVVDKLMHMRAHVVGMEESGERETPRIMASRHNAHTSAIGRHYTAHPELSELGQKVMALQQDHNIISISAKPLSQSMKVRLHHITAQMYALYTANKHHLPLLSADTMANELSAAGNSLTIPRQQTDKLEHLYGSYDSSPNEEEERRRILQRIREQLTAVECPDVKIIYGLTSHTFIELMMGRFEQFEARGLDLKGMTVRLGQEGFSPKPWDATHDAQAGTKFRSPTKIEKQQITTMAFCSEASRIAQAISGHSSRYTAIMNKYRESETQQITELAAAVLKSAESNINGLFATGKVELDLDRPPFTLIERDQEGSFNPTEFIALMILTKERMLQPVRNELTELLRSMPAHGPIDFETALTEQRNRAGEPAHAHGLADASRVVELMVDRHLHAAHEAARPIGDILEGKKPRVKSKNPPAEQIEAAALYDRLHIAGLSGPEKALTVAIVNGKWNHLMNIKEGLRVTLATVAEFSNEVGLDTTVAKHPSLKLADTSFEPVLKNIAATLRAERSAVAQALTSGQLTQLRSVVSLVADD